MRRILSIVAVREAMVWLQFNCKEEGPQITQITQIANQIENEAACLSSGGLLSYAC